jgi:hypothetical protein
MVKFRLEKRYCTMRLLNAVFRKKYGVFFFFALGMRKVAAGQSRRKVGTEAKRSLKHADPARQGQGNAQMLKYFFRKNLKFLKF